MNLDEFRVTVQKALSARGVKDVAFTPFAGCDAERVSFWQDGVRAHFAISTLQYTEIASPELLTKAVQAHAENAYRVAVEFDAQERARVLAEEAAKLKVTEAV